MKKYLSYLPHVIFAAALILVGSIGKLTGSESAVTMFTDIDMFGLGERFGRLAVGLGELGAGIGIFFAATRRMSALIGSAIMAGAIFFHVSLFGGSPLFAIVIMLIGFYLFLKPGCCNTPCAKKCESECKKTCSHKEEIDETNTEA